ncbi:MAG: phosphotransferase [Bacillota bacterium]
MILKTNVRDGDGFHNRLLFILKSKLGENIIDLERIKEGKWKMRTEKEDWFLKLYSSSRRLKLQQEVTEEILIEGFTQIPSFHDLHHTDAIEIDGKTAGLTDWIDTNVNYTYTTFSERQEALDVLQKFHHCSRKVLLRKDIKLLKKQRLLGKWDERLAEFRRNRQKMSAMVPLEIIDAYLQLGEQALAGMAKHGFTEENCILHGDLAHHNFLRNTKNELFIIDLDLISSGPPEVDYIQFANRIFPYINWCQDSLWKHEPLSNYKDSKTFLNSILFPSDIFREWNRFFRENHNYQKSVWYYLMNLTLQQFHARMLCCRKIQRKLK